MNKISRDEVRGIWRRCLIQFVALDYAIWHDKIMSLAGKQLSDRPSDIYVCLQDMLSYPLLYPRVLCELKRVADLSQKLEALTGVRPSPEIEKLFPVMIQGFGLANDEGVSESEKFLSLLFDHTKWYPMKAKKERRKLTTDEANEVIRQLTKLLAKETVEQLGDAFKGLIEKEFERIGNDEIENVRLNFNRIIKDAGLERLISALSAVQGLVRGKDLDIGIRDRILYDWAKLNDPKIWGAQVEAISYLHSQLPIVDGIFSMAKPTFQQQEYFPEALHVVTGFLRRTIVDKRKEGLKSLLRYPTSQMLKTVFTSLSSLNEGAELMKVDDEQLDFFHTAWWIMSDEPELATYFKMVVSRLEEDDALEDHLKATTLKGLKRKLIQRALFPGSLVRGGEITGAVLLGLSLERFKREKESLAQLGVIGISELAGGYSI